MTAYPAGIAVARAASSRGSASSQFKNPPRIKKLFGASRGVRRRSAGVPIEQRLPRFLGSGLALGFFSVVIGFGLWQGGHIDGFIRDYGEPHHALARAVGLGLEQVTISGISQMGENEVLAAAGINSTRSPELASGNCRSRSIATALICGPACSIVAPSASRPITRR